jgi:hypothetical protein
MDNYLEWYPNLDWLLNMASHNILFHPNKKKSAWWRHNHLKLGSQISQQIDWLKWEKKI